jgi:hypothetical protein
MLTAQQIFDRVLTHLRTQGQAARHVYDGGTSCRYRLEQDNGPTLSCAVGCLIPDDVFEPGIEGSSIGAILSLAEDYEKAGGLDNMPAHKWLYENVREHLHLLQDLQRAHDGHMKGETAMLRWECQMRAIAAYRNLTYTEPTQGA